MSKKSTAIVPADVAAAQLELQRWRKKRRPGKGFPEWLWSRAAELAVEHGVAAVSRWLKLDYMKLKKLAADLGQSVHAQPQFIDIRFDSPAPGMPAGMAVIEWMRPDGQRLVARGLSDTATQCLVEAFGNSLDR